LKYRVSKNTKALFFINIFLFSLTKIFGQSQLNWNKYSFTEQKMGSSFTITFSHNDSLLANSFAKNAFKIVDSLNTSFSDYLENSEISNISKKAGNGEWIPISKDLMAIIKDSQKAHTESDGAFDICLGNLTKLWRISRKTKTLPKKYDLQRALSSSGMQYLQIDSTNKQVRLIKKGASIDLGGIGKGFVAQKVYDYLVKNNMKSIIVDAAGNMAIGDGPFNQKKWRIGLEMPERSIYANLKMLYLRNCAISTSGDVYQNVVINGKKYSHIINPKTGLGLGYQRQVTVICENATKADWLSTTCYILPKIKAVTLAKKMGAELIIFENRNQKIKEYKTSDFSKYYLEN
jgi:FAD:protein FMN transferase